MARTRDTPLQRGLHVSLVGGVHPHPRCWDYQPGTRASRRPRSAAAAPAAAGHPRVSVGFDDTAWRVPRPTHEGSRWLACAPEALVQLSGGLARGWRDPGLGEVLAPKPNEDSEQGQARGRPTGEWGSTTGA